MTLKRVTDGDVALHGESQYQQGTEVLRREEDDWIKFTESRLLYDVQTPLGL